MRVNNVVYKPIITEKSIKASSNDVYTFEVNTRSSKNAIAKEIEKMFEVDVVSVHTMIMHGKKRRLKSSKRWQFITTKKWKKALVELASGQHIDLFSEGGKN